MVKSPYFLPYQVRWLQDNSRLKIVEKSRRIGMTFVQAYEDVRDAACADNPMDVWFSSADESAAREYIRYSQQWAKVLRVGSEPFNVQVVEDADMKTFTITFATGKRITALSSKTKSFRSKGGKVVLDEFAFHEDQEEMWKAALPVVTWGFPVRILSTYNGKGNRYFRMVEDAKRGNDWSLHSTTIIQAVDQGLADRILQQDCTRDRRQQWLDELRATVGDEETWQQEYLCNPVDEATAYLTWDLIQSAEHPEAGLPAQYEPSQNRCYLGFDVARRRDFSVLWVLEQVGDVLWTREVVSLKNAPFDLQESELDRLIRRYRVCRVCIDQTGMGEQLVERARRRHGSRVEGVKFTNSVKQDLAQELKRRFEDRQLRNPADKLMRESFHSVRRMTTSSGNVRFDAAHSEIGHADHFWAAALAVHALGSGHVPIEFKATGRSITGEFEDDSDGWDGFGLGGNWYGF